MPLFLLMLRKKRSWDKNVPRPWIPTGQVPGDICQDFRVREGRLSVWHIDDNGSNLDVVLTALAVTKQTIAPVDFGLFQQTIVTDLQISIEETPGETPLAIANIWHRDLVALSFERIFQLATRMFDSINTDRRSDKQMQRLALEATDRGEINLDMIHPDLRNRIAH